MKIMVTGGAGFIGSYIVDLLIAEGYNTIVIDNLVTGNKKNINPKAKFYECDILEELDEVIKKELPEVIIHQAALVYVQQSLQKPLSNGMVNVLGTLNILQSAKLHQVKKIIYASTCAVYGETGVKSVKEEDPVSPISFYGASKWMGEVYVRLFHEIFNLDYTILRYANVYGPGQKREGEGGVIPIFIQNIQEGTRPIIFGQGKQTRDFVYVQDVARANLLAIHKGSQETFNIGTGIATTINDLYQSLNNLIGKNIEPHYEPERMGDVEKITLDSTKAKKELGWEPRVTLLEGLQETIKDNRAQ